METIYVFRVALKYRKGLWRRIEIKKDQAFGEFDEIISLLYIIIHYINMKYDDFKYSHQGR